MSAKTDWNNLTNYIDTVGIAQRTFSFNKTQNFVRVTTKGNANVNYTIGSQSGTLTPGQSVSVSEKITSFNLTAVSGVQTIEVWAIEDGTEKIEDNGNSLDDVVASLAESMPLSGVNTHSLQTTYDANGNLTQTKEFDVNNTLLIQQNITYNVDGTINTITETFNGKQHVTTLNYVNGSLDPVNPMTRSVF